MPDNVIAKFLISICILPFVPEMSIVDLYLGQFNEEVIVAKQSCSLSITRSSSAVILSLYC